MQKIPDRYFTPENEKAAIANIRYWLSQGLTIEMMARQITRRYHCCRVDATRIRLGKLLAAVYDFETPGTARRCADLFGLDITEGLTVSENIAIGGNKPDERIFRLLDFTENVIMWHQVIKPFPCDKLPMVVPQAYDEYVLTLSDDHNIYALRENDLSITIFIVNNCNDDILVDEEQFINEAPLYFTESTHFISPVFKIRLIKSILDFTLKSIGYPNIPINLKVIFSHPNANLINRDCYVADGDNAGDWEGVEVLTMSDILPCVAISSVKSFLAVKDADKDSLPFALGTMLFNSMQATGLLYEIVWRHNKHINLTHKTLERLAKEYSIFKRPSIR